MPAAFTLWGSDSMDFVLFRKLVHPNAPDVISVRKADDRSFSSEEMLIALL
jgi:hypothetical protein